MSFKTFICIFLCTVTHGFSLLKNFRKKNLKSGKWHSENNYHVIVTPNNNADALADYNIRFWEHTTGRYLFGSTLNGTTLPNKLYDTGTAGLWVVGNLDDKNWANPSRCGSNSSYVWGGIGVCYAKCIGPEWSTSIQFRPWPSSEHNCYCLSDTTTCNRYPHNPGPWKIYQIRRNATVFSGSNLYIQSMGSWWEIRLEIKNDNNTPDNNTPWPTGDIHTEVCGPSGCSNEIIKTPVQNCNTGTHYNGTDCIPNA